MENIVITWRELLVVIILVLAVYIAELLLLARSAEGSFRKPRWFGIFRGKQPEATRLAETELRKEIEQLQQRLLAIEARLIQSESIVADAPPPSPYMRAIQMARQRHDAERIASSCGISRSEAEMIISMHGSQILQ